MTEHPLGLTYTREGHKNATFIDSYWMIRLGYSFKKHLGYLMDLIEAVTSHSLSEHRTMYAWAYFRDLVKNSRADL